MPNHEVKTFSPMCSNFSSVRPPTVFRAWEITIVGHLEAFDVGEELADSVVEQKVDLAEPGQVEGTELGEHERGEQLDGNAHFEFVSYLEHETPFWCGCHVVHAQQFSYGI